MRVTLLLTFAIFVQQQLEYRFLLLQKKIRGKNRAAKRRDTRRVSFAARILPTESGVMFLIAYITVFDCI